ncbi:N2,N2-dimethylguanosine tRNA methyltransferase [Colletotrichum truncatum]|uniref:N2,N2-dimethylguanosine tRNA methyltransferase n=1 Tax=Colletotrichum truncatum TaxID=5467 RepID=A0ACC3Z1D3_COLTU|nr:N2,N2-dimethylguanosine tRNA methyltransferase [Colletotrichum truncatum]KAF6800392.1 N2,N2-dimethylguanosine tRNA methyltransferase [Colletotrichum truncatum]
MDSKSLRSKASEETLISLLQLDPSPIETPPADTDKDLPPLPEDTLESSTASLKSTSSAPGLSGSGHGLIFYLTRIQKFSSYLIPVFTSIHLANTSIIPLLARSVAASEIYLLQSREIYQTSLTEPLLVGLPVLAHIASGVALRLVRRSQNLQRYGGNTPGMYALYRAQTGKTSRTFTSNTSTSAARIWPPLSYISLSGYAFTAFLAAHVSINRILPLRVEGDSSNIGLAFVAHGFARHPVLSWLAYTGLLAVGCGHMIWGAAKWLGFAPTAMGWSGSGASVIDRKTRRRKRRAWWALHGIVAAAFGTWAAGGLGIVARGGLTDGWVGKLYDELFSRAYPL